MRRLEVEDMMRLGPGRLSERSDVPLSVCGPLGDISPEERQAIIKGGLGRGLTEKQALEEYEQSLLDL